MSPIGTDRQSPIGTVRQSPIGTVRQSPIGSDRLSPTRTLLVSFLHVQCPSVSFRHCPPVSYTHTVRSVSHALSVSLLQALPACLLYTHCPFSLSCFVCQSSTGTVHKHTVHSFPTHSHTHTARQCPIVSLPPAVSYRHSDTPVLIRLSAVS